MEAFSFEAATLGQSGCYEEVLQLLRAADYTDAFICKRFNLRRAEEFEIDRKKRSPLPLPESAADVLLQLFLAGEALPPELAASLLGAECIALLEGMGLLKNSKSGEFYSTVSLYPVEELYIASDRWNTPDGAPLKDADDTVYPAFIPNTRLFLKHLPECNDIQFLDLCAGTGVAALRAAKRGAAQSWSGDIAERSTRFAEFNRRLNAVPNARLVTGDLYQGLDGLLFDVIVAHPPYVPTLQPRWIFASGGGDGEEITRRIIEGLPDYLNDCGCFMALTMASDRAGRPLEYRIREWLGSRHTAFDIALIIRRELDPKTFAFQANRDTIRTREESEKWNELFAELQIQSLVYGFICIQKRAGTGRPFTVRRQAPPAASRSPWEWLLQWETASHGDTLSEIILNSRLYASQRTDFDVQHKLEHGIWTPTKYTFRIDYPFSMECDAQPWMAHLTSLCNGQITGRDLLRMLVENNVFPKSTSETEFAQAAASLVSGGFIEVEGYRPPNPF